MLLKCGIISNMIENENNQSFYLIRYEHDKPYIPCFNLARLLHLSESDILSETVKINENISFLFLMNFYLVIITYSLSKNE